MPGRPVRLRRLTRLLQRHRSVPSLLVAAVAVLAVAVTATVVLFAAHRAPDPVRSAADTAAALTTTPTLVSVIGDSVSAGTPYGGLGAANWTSILGGDRRWSVTDTAVGGTGYTNPGPGKAPFEAAQLGRATVPGTRLVLVQGSRNDLLTPPEQVRAAATRLFHDLKAALPAARIVAIGPMWLHAGPPAQAAVTRDAVKAAADAEAVSFLDPLAERWFDDPAASRAALGGDGVHPTDAGHAAIAGHVEADLAHLGL
ncbi:SGNH/GDSL hydrolase family protein [Actinomycetospora chiangmaiensis]|uniref:SGNH/GDSL hydrolase family protein n=1 Tax=Actinomycetospora chiangmaiensis TaxID=402650 RepID=UPI00039E9C9D|nr:SGNH/GDSL hydrolase family protein [Actinomycetospora chiangmaiensis]